MAQSTLYKIGAENITSTVDVTSDSGRDMGSVTVDEILAAIDIADRSTRDLGNAAVTNTVSVEEQGVVGVSVNNAAQVSATTSTGGAANAAAVDLGIHRTKVDLFYDVVDTTGDIVIEVSTDGVAWREYERLTGDAVITGGEVAQLDTAFQHVRAYATHADADVTLLELVGRAT